MIKKNFSLYFLFLVLFTLSIKSQSASKGNIMTLLKFEHQYLLPDEIQEYTDVVIRSLDGNIYLFVLPNDAISAGGKVTIYKINIIETKKIYATIPKKDWITNFIISEDRLYLMGYNHILKYYFRNDSTSYINNIALDYTYLQMNIEGNKLILFRRCWACDNAGIKTLIIDTSGQKINYNEFITPPGFILEQYFPHKRLDYLNNKFIFSNIIDYNIIIYDYNLDTIGILHRDIDILEKNKENKDLFDTLNYREWSKNHFSSSDNLKNTSRVDIAEFIDDTTIFVCYCNMTVDSVQYRYHHDIWKYNSYNKRWELNYSDMTDRIIYNERDTISWESVGIGIVKQYTISNGKFLCIRNIPIDLNNADFSKITFRQFWDMRKAYYEKNETKLSLLIYSLKLP